jgi:hypothetical protein
MIASKQTVFAAACTAVGLFEAGSDINHYLYAV